MENTTLVQAVLLSKRTHSRKDAARDAYRFGALKIESGRKWWRLRLRQPGPLKKKGYRFRIKDVKPGVRLVVAAKGSKGMRLRRNPWVVRGGYPGQPEEVMFKTHPQAKLFQERHGGKIYYVKRQRRPRPSIHPR